MNQQGKRRRSEKSPPLCIYCRTAKADTRDHVPPEVLFPIPKPSTLVTVPACRACNRGFQKDDEVFALLLTSLLEVNPQGRSVFRSKVAEGLLKRSPKLRKALAATMHFRPHTFPGGQQGLAPALLIERDRMLRVLRRIVRGLFWHEYRC